MTWPGCWEVNRRDCTSADASTNELIFFLKTRRLQCSIVWFFTVHWCNTQHFYTGMLSFERLRGNTRSAFVLWIYQNFFSLSFFFRSLKSLIAVSQYLLNSLFLCAEFARKHYNTTWIMFPLDLSLFFIYYWYC